MASESSGTISLGDGRKFVWMLSGERSPEIWGCLQSSDGNPIAGTGGWWRTTDAQDAARKAALVFPAA